MPTACEPTIIQTAEEEAVQTKQPTKLLHFQGEKNSWEKKEIRVKQNARYTCPKLYFILNFFHFLFLAF